MAVNRIIDYGRDPLDEVRAIKTKITRYWPTMTTSEQYQASDELREAQHRGIMSVGKRAINALDMAADKVKRQRRYLDEYIASEARSWDPARFSAELGIASVLLDMALKAAEPEKSVQNLLTEAIQSNDRYKIRAIVETLPGAVAKGANLDARLKLNNVLTTGADKLKEIRETPEIQKQRQAITSAYSEFTATREQFVQISKDMGENAENGTGIFGPVYDRWRPYMRDGLPDILDTSENNNKGVN